MHLLFEECQPPIKWVLFANQKQSLQEQQQQHLIQVKYLMVHANVITLYFEYLILWVMSLSRVFSMHESFSSVDSRLIFSLFLFLSLFDRYLMSFMEQFFELVKKIFFHLFILNKNMLTEWINQSIRLQTKSNVFKNKFIYIFHVILNFQLLLVPQHLTTMRQGHRKRNHTIQWKKNEKHKT